MKIKEILSLALIMWVISNPFQTKAQYYEMVNGLQNAISPILSGSGNYQGSIEAGYSHILSHYKGDFIELSTSQGYRYSSWFYMGAGLGLDVLFAHKNSDWSSTLTPPPGIIGGKKVTEKAFMLPIFTDFRFNIGKNNSASTPSFYLDLKIGCSFLLSNKYIAIGEGYLTNREYFFLRPSIGVRIPVNKKNAKQAVDIGVSYKLLTSNYWVNYNNNITLQSIGANLAFEW